MGIIGGSVGYQLLRRLDKVSPGNEISTAYNGLSKMEVLFGAEIWKELTNKTVIDFGCEDGVETIDMARHGVGKVIGLDIREDALARGRAAAKEAGLADRCIFTTEVKEKADVVVSLDAFEHFSDPAAMLRVMRSLLKDDG